MSWLFAFTIAAWFAVFSTLITLLLLRRQRARFERLLVEFGHHQLTTSKRLTDVMLEQHQQIQRTSQKLGILQDTTIASLRRDTDSNTRHLAELLFEADDLADEPESRTAKPTRVLN